MTRRRERFERYQAAVALRDELAQLDQTHPSSTPLPVLRADVERLRATDTRIATLESLLAGEVQVDFELPPERQWRPRARQGGILVAVGLLIAVAGGALGIAGLAAVGVPAMLVGVVVALAGGVLAVGRTASATPTG